jgi:hypothetical protein
MGIFVIGLLAYALAQLRVGLRDLGHSFALARMARRAPGAGGRVLVRGRARGTRLLSPPAGGTGVVAWEARGSYGFGDDAESLPFVLEPVGADEIQVDAARLVLLASEATDLFGNRVRALHHGAEVVVYGVMHEHEGRSVLRDVPGRGVVVQASATAVMANLGRAALALVAVATFGAVAVIAHLP